MSGVPIQSDSDSSTIYVPTPEGSESSIKMLPEKGSNQSSKKWSITAIVVGALVVGVGICGGLGLLNKGHILPLPDGLSTFIGNIGYAGLGSITGVGLVGGSIVLGVGIYKYRQNTDPVDIERDWVHVSDKSDSE